MTTVTPNRPVLPALRSFIGLLPEWNFGTGGLLKTGISWRTCGLAVVSTMGLFFVVNLVLVVNVHSTFKSAKLTEVADAANVTEAVDRLVRAGLLDSKDLELQAWVQHSLRNPDQRPAREQVLDLFDSVATISPEGKVRRAALLKGGSTGQMSGFLSYFFWVGTTFPTGSDLFEQLADAGDGKAWRLALKQDNLKDEKRRFIIAYLNALLAKVQPALREVNRFNGRVKWLATFAAFLILWAVAGRLLLLLRVQSYWLGASREAASGWRARLRFYFMSQLPPLVPDEHEELLAIANQLAHSAGASQAAVLIRNRMKELQQSIESTVYATYSYGVGLLPSLGFIGTVWGLGGALLQANGLFSVADRQKTIGSITHELGIAFDTTLIALTASVITGLCIAALRLRERWLLDQIGLELIRVAQAKSEQPPTSPGPSPVSAPNSTSRHPTKVK